MPNSAPYPSINYADLVQYTDQMAMPLLREAVFSGDSIQTFTVQTGIKFADTINIYTSNPVLQAGGCGTISPTGSVTPMQVQLQVCNVKLEEAICIDDLEKYYFGMYAKKGSWNETTPNYFNEVYNLDKKDKIKKAISIYSWQGDTAGTYNSNYTLCNGVFHDLLLTSASQSIYYTSITMSAGTSSNTLQTGAWTSTNAIAIVDNMIDIMTANITDIVNKPNLYIYVNVPNFRTYVRAWRDRGNGTGNYWVEPTEGSKLEFTVPGTNIKVKADPGLDGINKALLTYGENIIFGTDMMSDTEQYVTWFELRDNQSYFRAKWKMGFAVAFPQYCVVYNG